jgi:hypothetical protein
MPRWHPVSNRVVSTSSTLGEGFVPDRQFFRLGNGKDKQYFVECMSSVCVVYNKVYSNFDVPVEPIYTVLRMEDRATSLPARHLRSHFGLLSCGHGTGIAVFLACIMEVFDDMESSWGFV